MWFPDFLILQSEDNVVCVLSCFSHACLLAMLWTVAPQAPLSMGFTRQEYWSGLPCLLPGELPFPGIKPTSLMSPALKGRSFTTSITWEAQLMLSWPKSLCGFSHKMLGKELNEIFVQPKSIHLRDYTDSARFLKSLLGSKEKHFILKKMTKEYN